MLLKKRHRDDLDAETSRRDEADGPELQASTAQSRVTPLVCVFFAIAFSLDLLGLCANHGLLGNWPKAVTFVVGFWVGWLSLGTAASVFFTPSRLGRGGWLIWSILLTWFLLANLQLPFCLVEGYSDRNIYMQTRLSLFLDIVLALAIVLRLVGFTLIWYRTSSSPTLRVADAFPPLPVLGGLVTLSAVAIFSLSHIGMMAGGDAVFHVSTVYRGVQNDSMAMWFAAGHNNYPSYALNAWHAVLAIMTRLSGIPTPLIWLNSFFFLIPVIFLLLYWAMREFFDRERVHSGTILASLGLFLGIALVYGCTPGIVSQNHVSFFTFGMWVWGYNQYLIFFFLLGPSFVFAARLLREGRWQDSVALGVLLSTAMSVHILGGIILVLLLAVWFAVGVAVPAPGIGRTNLVLKAAVVGLIPLPRLGLIAFDAWKFIESAGKAVPQVKDDILESQIAGQPAAVFYFVPVLLLILLCALNWRTLRWRLFGLSLAFYFVMLLLPPGKEVLSRLFTFVLPIRLGKAMTFLVWVFGPCLLWQTLALVWEKVPPLRERRLPRLALTGALTAAILWAGLYATLPYKGKRLRRLYNELTIPYSGLTKRSVRLAESRAWSRLVPYFQGKDETVFVWPERTQSWALLFGSGRIQPRPALEKEIRAAMAKPPPWPAKLFQQGQIRVVLCESKEPITKGLQQLGYRSEGTWEHPTAGRYALLVLPGSFDTLGAPSSPTAANDEVGEKPEAE